MRSMRSVLLLLAITLPGANALSCMCASYDPANAAEMELLIAESDLVATVVVDDITEVADRVFEARLMVEKAMKGGAVSPLSLRQDFSGHCFCDPRLMPQQRYLVFIKFDASGTRQSGPIIAFPDAERFLSPLRALIGDS